MRRILIALLAISLFALPTSVLAGGMAVGPKAALNLADLTGSDVRDNSIKIGAAIGGEFTYSFTDLIALQAELLYTMKGANFDAGGSTVSTNLNYLEIPVMAKFSFLTGNVHPIVLIGPELSMLLSADTDGNDIKDEVNSTDYGLILGAGVDLGLGSGKLTIDARYDMGLVTVAKEQAGTSPDVKNSVISINVGYLFSL